MSQFRDPCNGGSSREDCMVMQCEESDVQAVRLLLSAPIKLLWASYGILSPGKRMCGCQMLLRAQHPASCLVLYNCSL